MTSAVETAPSHHRAWYETVGVPSASRGVVNEDSVSDSMTSSVVEHMSSFFAAHHNSAAAAALDSAGPRDYRSTGPYSRDMLASRYYHQHSPYASAAVASHGKVYHTVLLFYCRLRHNTVVIVVIIVLFKSH